jgi:hypothetical protein
MCRRESQCHEALRSHRKACSSDGSSQQFQPNLCYQSTRNQEAPQTQARYTCNGQFLGVHVIMMAGITDLMRLPYELSGVRNPFNGLETTRPSSSTRTSMGCGSDISLNSGLGAIQRSTKLRAGISPLGDFSMQIVPPVITTSTLASGDIPVVTLSSSGES